MPIPAEIIAAVNALLQPYGESFTQPTASAPTGGFLSPKDAAHYLGVSRPFLYRRIKEGQIKVHKLDPRRNGKVIIARSELDRYVLSKG